MVRVRKDLAHPQFSLLNLLFTSGKLATGSAACCSLNDVLIRGHGSLLLSAETTPDSFLGDLSIIYIIWVLYSVQANSVHKLGILTLLSSEKNTKNGCQNDTRFFSGGSQIICWYSTKSQLRVAKQILYGKTSKYCCCESQVSNHEQLNDFWKIF